MYLAGVEDKVFALLDVRLQFWHCGLDEIHLEVRQFAESEVLLHSILLQSQDTIHSVVLKYRYSQQQKIPSKGLSIIVNIMKSVHRVLFFYDTVPPCKKSTIKMLILNDPV